MGIGSHAESQAVQPASTDRFKRYMVRMGCGPLVEKYRNPEFPADPASQPLGQEHTIVHRRATKRHKGHDVGRSDQRMDTFMSPHVNEVRRHPDGEKSRLNHFVWFTHQRQHRPIVIFIPYLVQYKDSGDGGHGVKKSLNSRPIPSFAEIRNTFDETIHSILSWTSLRDSGRQNNEAGGTSLTPPASHPHHACAARDYLVFFT